MTAADPADDRGAGAPDAPRRLVVPDGAAIGYRIWRSERPRPLLVLVHGAASNLTRWSEFVRHTDLRGSWDLLRLDLRGHGSSLWRGRLGLAAWCADLAAILDAEGYARAVVAGHCLGANVALAFAARHPDRAAGLILIEPMFQPALTGAMRRVAALRPLLAPVIGLVRALSAVGLHRRRLAPLDLEDLDRRTRAAIASDEGGRRLYARYASPWLDLASTPTATYLQDLVTVTGPLPAPSAIAVPVLALVSTGSAFTDPAITRAQLAAFPRCRVVALPARHWIPTEAPEAMRGAIEDWCRSLDLEHDGAR